MKESLILIMGPPVDDFLKELFAKFQQSKKSGERQSDGDWESFETKVIKKLFAHIGDSPSIIDELFWQLFDSPIKIKDYFFGMGVHRGLWVANITISRSNVLREQGSDIIWPPSKDINSMAATSLAGLLKREWVYVISLFQ